MRCGGPRVAGQFLQDDAAAIAAADDHDVEVMALAAEQAGQAVVLKVDTERHPSLAQRYQVQGIPNFVVFNRGRKVAQHAGLANPREMKRWLETAR